MVKYRQIKGFTSLIIMPLKVLHVASGDRWAGAEVQLFTLLKALKKLGCSPSALLLNDGELAARLKNESIPVSIISESENGFFALLRKIKTQLKEQQPDIIHTHRQKENILGALANKLSLNIPSCRTLHGASEFKPSWKQKVQRRLDDFVGRWLQQCIIAVSDDMQHLLQEKFGCGHVTTIYNGVDIQALRSEVKQAEFIKNKPDSIHVGIIGRIEPVKRIDLFLKIASDLIAYKKDVCWQFHIVGDGSRRHEMEELAKTLGIIDSVTFHGHQAAMASIISSLNVVVMCSDHEGMPMTALETIALNTALVAHNIGGLQSFNGFDGVYLVSGNDQQEYCQILSELSVVGSLNGLNSAFSEKFSSQAMAEKTVSMYRKLLA